LAHQRFEIWGTPFPSLPVRLLLARTLPFLPRLDLKVCQTSLATAEIDQVTPGFHHYAFRKATKRNTPHRNSAGTLPALE